MFARQRYFRFTLILIAGGSLAGCATTQETFEAELDRLQSMTCPELETELLLADTRKQVKVIRRMQGQKNCELKPLALSNKRKMKPRSTRSMWGNRREVGYTSVPRSTRPQ